MRHWSSRPHFQTLLGRLAITSGHDFQRAILPFLHVIDLRTIEAPPLSSADCCGIDHLVWSDTSPLPLVVQAKGFKVGAHELGKIQLKQCLASIETFRRSGVKASKYLLVHNRDGRSELFRNTIKAALGSLVADGCAKVAELWDCNQLITASFEAMLLHIRSLLNSHRLTLLDTRDFSESADILLDDVPFRVAELKINQWGLVDEKEVGQFLENPAKTIAQLEGGSFNVLLGEFGLGKTTTALRSLKQFSAESSPLFLSAAALEKRAGGSRDFLRQCVNVGEILKGFPSEDWETLRLLIPAPLERLLVDPETSVILIIDALDEAPMFHHRQGVQDIFNFLYSTQIPIILTMRTEFWTSRHSDFTTFEGPRQLVNRRTKSWKLLELLQWDWTQIRELITRAAAKEAGNRQRNLTALLALLESRGYEHLYGDIPRRPLFLRMILDSVAEHGTQKIGRAQLVESWVRLKILRDIREPARLGGRRIPILEQNESINLTTELAFAAMEIAAREMTITAKAGIELTSTCLLESVLRQDRRLENIVDATGLFLSSLLLPVANRTPGTPIGIRFAHRVFQEYFLARHSLTRVREFPPELLPKSVQEWREDLLFLHSASPQ